MATAPISNRRSLAAAPPPPPEPEPEQEQTLFDYIIACIHAVNPSFPQQGPKEDDQAYLTRIVQFLSPNNDDGMPEEAWNSLDQEAQQWYDTAVDAMTARQQIPAPQGFYEEEGAAEEEPEPVAPPAAAAPAKKAMPAGAVSGLQKYREQQAALKAQKLAEAQQAPAPQTNGQHAPPPRARTAPAQAAAPAAPAVPARRGAPAPVAAPPPPAAPQRRGAVQQPVYTPPQPVAPQRRGPPPRQQAAAPEPQRSTSRQSIGRKPDVIDDLRAQVMYDPNITLEALIAYARSPHPEYPDGYPQVDSSIGAILSQVRAIMNLASRMNMLKEPWPA